MDLNVPKRWQRKNGWQRPLTPRQIILLVTFVFGAVAGFGIFLPFIPRLLQTVGYVCLTVLYVWVLICNRYVFPFWGFINVYRHCRLSTSRSRPRIEFAVIPSYKLEKEVSH
uniref:PrgI family protein n=1 Tax=Leptobrachium leishanense TaxID=445787 RepID=A0A8C5QSI7_9ANUR